MQLLSCHRPREHGVSRFVKEYWIEVFIDTEKTDRIPRRVIHES